jgi:bifunctional enzyme CysN/CysC
VIWVTGYSSAGKTSLARLVASHLRDAGAASIFLDGDDLRGILGDRGYSDEERRELARIYFRLSSHIASQGMTVVIAAAAMYSEVFEWFRENIPRGMLVYADVPEEVRRRRDAATRKGVYEDDRANAAQYEPPRRPDLRIENSEGADLQRSARAIVKAYRDLGERGSNHGRSAHWDSCYAKGEAPMTPSSFAVHVREQLPYADAGLIDVGCGNGRDSAYFAREGFRVTATDVSRVAIERCREAHADRTGITFEHGTLDELAVDMGRCDVVYSRFVLHAMTLEEEEAFLAAAADLLNFRGRLFVECRSIHDPLARKGEVLSPTERISGHYRRFIAADELVDRVIAAGLEVESLVESDGLAVYRDDNPVVIRLAACKPRLQAGPE